MITRASTKELEALQHQILELKKELGALILAHNYQRPEVQDIADFVGDSLELARLGKESQAQVIVLCAVHFMAENVAILNPGRTVLLAEGTAGCPMADMIDVDDLREWKRKYPKAVVVCYVNSSAAVKAESDICCTSANAVKIVESLPDEEILFIPDQNLGKYVASKTKKRIILYPGYCVTHKRLTADQVRRAREVHTEATVIVHPECSPEVIALADAVLSTSQMIRYAQESPAKTFLVGTEEGLLYRLRQDNPGKTFYIISNSMVCPNMKRTRLEAVLETMQQRRNAVTVPEPVRSKALHALERMLAVK